MGGPSKVATNVPMKDFPGGSFNMLVDDYWKRRGRGGGQLNLPDAAKYATVPVLVHNSTSTEIEPGMILGFSAPMFTLTDNADEKYETPSLKGVGPDSATHASQFVVAHDYIPVNECAAATLMGLAWVQAQWTDAAHTTLKVVSGEHKLQSGTGGIKPVWHETIPGTLPATVWALIYIGGAGGGGDVSLKFARASSDITAASDWDTPGSGTAIYVDIDGNEGEEVDVTNRYFNRFDENLPLWILEADGLYYVINVGCNPQPPIE